MQVSMIFQVCFLAVSGRSTIQNNNDTFFKSHIFFSVEHLQMNYKSTLKKVSKNSLPPHL